MCVSFNIVYLCSGPGGILIILNDLILTFNMVVIRVKLKVYLGCS